MCVRDRTTIIFWKIQLGPRYAEHHTALDTKWHSAEEKKEQSQEKVKVRACSLQIYAGSNKQSKEKK
jgi:hypothetical protein